MKKTPKLHVYVEFKDGSLRDELLDEAVAEKKFQDYVILAVTLGFKTVRSIRLGMPGHVRYEYRDIRSIVNQNNLFEYES